MPLITIIVPDTMMIPTFYTTPSIRTRRRSSDSFAVTARRRSSTASYSRASAPSSSTSESKSCASQKRL